MRALIDNACLLNGFAASLALLGWIVGLDSKRLIKIYLRKSSMSHQCIVVSHGWFQLETSKQHVLLSSSSERRSFDIVRMP